MVSEQICLFSSQLTWCSGEKNKMLMKFSYLWPNPCFIMCLNESLGWNQAREGLLEPQEKLDYTKKPHWSHFPTLLHLVLDFIEFDPFDPHDILFHKSGCSVDGFNYGLEWLWLVSLSEREQASEDSCHSELVRHEDHNVTITQTLTAWLTLAITHSLGKLRPLFTVETHSEETSVPHYSQPHCSSVLSSPSQDAERQHREVVSIYRTHLLSAAQVRLKCTRLRTCAIACWFLKLTFIKTSDLCPRSQICLGLFLRWSGETGDALVGK